LSRKGLLAVAVILLLGAFAATQVDLAWLLSAATSTTPEAKVAEQGKPSAGTRATLAWPQGPNAPQYAGPGGGGTDPRMAVRTPASAKPSDAKTASLAKPAEAPRSAPEPQRPASADSAKFDVVRIDPEGASVFAGRAPPNARVTVLVNEQPVASATANESGEWSTVIERSFPPGEHKLSLRAKLGGQGRETDGQSARITIAASPPRPAPTATQVATSARTASPPAPITFVYDEDTFTEPGRKQAAALTEFLKQRNLQTVTLSGHADPRGSDEYNMELSRRRLETVERYLRQAGYTGKVVLQPMGKREPYPAPQRAQMSREEAFQLDRRVELRATP
jgi:outer membrane protein OmpA-like peptidoglycan-associated protein